ncbi:MAG: PH domain-containing protein [Pseudomonadota bacterium]|nr:PH domain-containing protein [Pseudomonadota bacterium]
MDTAASAPPLSPEPDASPVASADHDDDSLTKLDPNYVSALRLTTVITAIPCIIGSVIAEVALLNGTDGAWPVPFGVLIGLVVLIAIAFIIRLPARRWQARGYNMSADRLRVVRGILWRSDTIVPFGRVQHIDVDQGPIERALDIATITLHTAGNHNASVHLPGLNHAIATQIREEIRAHIKRDTM